MSMKNPDSNVEMQNEPAVESADSESPPVSQEKSMFEEHKGKLAIGVAATLGVMIFYNWLEKQLAKDDPEAHARLLRLKAVVRAREADLQHEESPGKEEFDGVVASQVMNCKGADGVSAAR